MEQRTNTAGNGERESLILCRNSQGIEVRSVPLRLTRFQVVFEVYNPYSILQLSEVLSEFRIFMNERLVYSGRAVVSNIVNTGILLVCEATLGDSWLDVDIFSPVHQKNRLRAEFMEFLREWEKVYRILPEFKVVVADMQTFLMDLRRWLEQIEMGTRSEPVGDRAAMEEGIIEELRDPVVPLVLSWFARFDEVASRVAETQLPAHRAYARRLLHPLVLCSPFVYRTYQKPLGYAGDYEMVNMILRPPYEGASLFAKLVNVCFLTNPPAEAHRNRIRQLVDRLVAEARRCQARGRSLRVLNLGCGPCMEVRQFLREFPESDQVEFTLMDFNEETLQHVEEILTRLRGEYRRSTVIRLVKKSVHQILKDAVRPVPDGVEGQFDFIYCAGLFDYMSDRICKRLMNYFHGLLAPGGLVIATNVDASKPFRHSMEFLLEWHLICRSPVQLESLRPDGAAPESCLIASESTGVNVFLEVRKPENV